MMQLSEELTSTENKVAFARQAYNDAVMSYNNAREVFPSSIVAGMFSFAPAQLLDIAKPEAREAPKVSFERCRRPLSGSRWISTRARPRRAARRAGW